MIIAGLGNPGTRYSQTRHNIGFRIVDLIAERWGRPAFREKFRGEVALAQPVGNLGDDRIYLLKPQTFMNLSGESVQPAATFFKKTPSQILVVHDELDLPFGRLQLKRGGGAGGHNGLKSIASRLGTPDFLRLRVGIGRPSNDFKGQVADFVLQAFAPSEEAMVSGLLNQSADAVELLVKSGEQVAMNQINRRPQ